MAFEGIPRYALGFLARLERNNDRAWFEEHRAAYEQLLLEPARDLVVALGEELDRRGIAVHADPRVNGSIFRINRDTRDALLLGAGRHHLEPPVLERYRDAVADAERGAALIQAVERVEAAGFELGGHRYKRMPGGYEADGRRGGLLLHDGLFAYAEQRPVPPQAHTAELPALCADAFAALEPLQAWLFETLES